MKHWLVAVSLFITGVLVGPQTPRASAHKHKCLPQAKLCLGGSLRKAVKQYTKDGFQTNDMISKRLCDFYMPPVALRKGWTCSLLLSGMKRALLVARRDQLVYIYAGGKGFLPKVSKMRQQWGRERRVLRSLEGKNLFWETASPYVVGAFFPFQLLLARLKKGPQKPFVKQVPKGIFLFHKRHLRGTPYAASFAQLRKLGGTKGARRWPTRCFHTLCLGDRKAKVLDSLKRQGYSRQGAAKFKHCRKMFSSSKIRGLHCTVMNRPWTRTVMRLVFSNKKLIFVQGERIARPPTVKRLRWVWGREESRKWVRGMLFIRWRKSRRARYILTFPLYGEKNSRTPIAKRRCVGFLLVDWKLIQSTKMGGTLKGLLGY